MSGGSDDWNLDVCPVVGHSGLTQLDGNAPIIDFSQMRGRSIEVTEGTEDSFDAAESAKIQAMEAISEGKQEIQYTMGETRGDHSIDIAINSRDESSKPCIFKVPEIFRRHSPKSFTPNSFSIGPIHYKKKYLKEQKKAEKIKQHYLKNLLTRTPTPQTTLEDFKRSILEVEEKARQCYDVPFDHISKDKFVDMLVLDGCFIIELLFQNLNIRDKDDDPVFSVCWVLQVLYHDLILLENQIPWFVLARLFNMTTSLTISDSTKALTLLVVGFFVNMFAKSWDLKIEGTLKSNHILDLLRNALVSSTEKKEESMSNWQLIPTATSLVQSGITFKKGESSNLLDIKFAFKEGVLEIPSLLIEETTCKNFRNLISYEQCYPNCKPKITSYAILLNNLINTTKDINVLHKAGIVDNWLNPSDTLEFFKNIYTDTYVKEFYYNKICEDVNEYTKQFWPRARAAYVNNHFADPWVIVSQIVAGIVVILTFLQTWYTIKQS